MHTQTESEAGGIQWLGRHPPPYGRTDQAHRWPVVGLAQQEVEEKAAVIDGQLLCLAATLAGLCTPAQAAGSIAPGSSVLMLVDEVGEDGVLHAGELLLAPAFMSAAAEAQVEASMEALVQATQQLRKMSFESVD